MKNNELIKSQGRIYRILDVSGQEILVIDCLKLTMPQWIEASDVQSAEMITDDELCQITEQIHCAQTVYDDQ